MISMSLKLLGCAGLALTVGVADVHPTSACTRAVYLGDGIVITGRSSDWAEDLRSNLWIFPRGMKRDGAGGPNTPTWVSKYGSVATSADDFTTADGMNEKGLVANLLYLANADYGRPEEGKPKLSVSIWAQYALDNFATVAEAVEALRTERSRSLRRLCRTSLRRRCICRSRMRAAIPRSLNMSTAS
jgi:penicillin V acylase-like amidase (Ntn superfamily)